MKWVWLVIVLIGIVNTIRGVIFPAFGVGDYNAFMVGWAGFGVILYGLAFARAHWHGHDLHQCISHGAEEVR